MKRILLTSMIITLLLAGVVIANPAMLYPSSREVTIIQGESDTVQFTLFYNDEEINLTSSSSWATFRTDYFNFTGQQGDIDIDVDIDVPTGADPKEYSIIIIAKSTGGDSQAIIELTVQPEVKELSIGSIGWFCPGRGIIFRVTDKKTGKGADGIISVYDSQGKALSGSPFSFDKGYTTSVTVPVQETLGVMALAESDGYETVSREFSISPTCTPSDGGYGGSNQLYLLFSETNITRTNEGPVNVSAMVKTNATTVKEADCVYHGAEQGVVSSGDGGFCNFIFNKTGNYTVWAEKVGYVSTEEITITISSSSAPPDTKPEPRINMFIDGVLNSAPNVGDKIKIVLKDEYGVNLPLSIDATLITNKSGTKTILISNGFSEEFTINEPGIFSISIPATNETSATVRNFSVKGTSLLDYWWVFLIVFGFIIIGSIIAIKKFGKPKKRPTGYDTPEDTGEKFVTKV